MDHLVGTILLRPIPRTGETIPAIGLGTWQTFDPPHLTPRALEPLSEVLRTFHAAGGRVLDSSPMYGKSERVTGTLSEKLGINADLFLATKLWTRGRAAGVRQLESSMREMKRTRLDLVEVHNLLDWQTQLGVLRAAKDEGKVRYIGVTHYQPSAYDEVEKVMRTQPIDFVQVSYSLGSRAAEERILPLAAEKGIAVLVNRPFEEATLFRRVEARALPAFAHRFASSWGEAFLKFILANEAVTAVIPATRRVAHLEEILHAGTGPLPDERERRQLVEALS